MDELTEAVQQVALNVFDGFPKIQAGTGLERGEHRNRSRSSRRSTVSVLPVADVRLSSFCLHTIQVRVSRGTLHACCPVALSVVQVVVSLQ